MHSHITESGMYAVLSVCLAKVLVCHAIVQFFGFSKSLFVATETEGSMHAQEVFTAVLPR